MSGSSKTPKMDVISKKAMNLIVHFTCGFLSRALVLISVYEVTAFFRWWVLILDLFQEDRDQLRHSCNSLLQAFSK